MKLASLLETDASSAKQLALLLQQVYLDELDWNLELGHKDGLIYGELKQCNGKPHGDIIVFVSANTLYMCDVVMFHANSVHKLMQTWPQGIEFIPHPNEAWASKFVLQNHGAVVS